MNLNYRHGIEVADLDSFWVDGEKFSGVAYQGFASVNTKTYVKEPKRSNDGSMPDIDEHDTFLVPRLDITFKYFNLRDYQRFCRAIQSANSYDVRYWDKDYGTWVTHNMYLEPAELTKVYNVRTRVLGVLDYSIKFIGTLNSRESYTLMYSPEYMIAGSGYTLSQNTTAYTLGKTYKKGDTVYWNNNYYEAIFYQDTFSGKAPTNTQYWETKTNTQWNYSATYNKGDVVYRQESDGIKYYEAIENNFSGYSLTNASFWKSLKVENYNASATYAKNQYCLYNNILYKSIYYLDEFSNKNPDDTGYWTKLINPFSGESFYWGDSTRIITANTLATFYNMPDGKSLKCWNTRRDGTGFNAYPNKNFTVTENTTLYPIFIDEESSNA